MMIKVPARRVRLSGALSRAAMTAALAAALGAASFVPGAAWSADPPPSASSGAAPREIHGHSDGFVAPGLAIAWAVLRGSSEATTSVVLRIEVDHMRYETVAIDGVDPFGGERRQRVPRTRLATPTDIRIPRSAFADAPRSELRFYAPRASEPSLVVYYVGVPDTTPEFADGAKLDAYLAPRIGKLFEQAMKP